MCIRDRCTVPLMVVLLQYVYQLNLITQKATSEHFCVGKVNIFVSNLTAMSFKFYVLMRCLEEIVKWKLPRFVVTCWNYNTHIVNVIFENVEKIS